jgi:hypothetical protein
VIYTACCGRNAKPGEVFKRDPGLNQWRHHPFCPTVPMENEPDPIMQPVCSSYPSCNGVVAKWPQMELWYCHTCGTEISQEGDLIWVNLAQPTTNA